MKKINVVGTSGSGKSTFSRKLASKLGYPHLEMDALYWRPNWGEPTDEEFFTILRKRLSAPTWVLDGNYNRTVFVKWAEVDTVVWLDFSFPRTLYQAVRRAFVRSLTRQELWPGTNNVETFRKSFMSRDSIILWTIQSFKKNRERYPQLFLDPKYQHIKFIRLTSPRMAKAFLANC